jgi:hypothetical protein
MSSVVFVLLVLATAGAVAAVVGTVVGTGSVMGFGHAFIYVDLPDRVGSSDLPLGRWVLASDVSANTTGFRLFVEHADAGQRFWFTLTLLPGSVLFVGALLLAYRLIRSAQRDGIHTSNTAHRLRVLGWFLLAGSAVRAVVEMVAANRLLATMVTNPVGWIGPIPSDFPWAVGLTAIGVLTFARIIRIGAEMRDELASTV